MHYQRHEGNMCSEQGIHRILCLYKYLCVSLRQAPDLWFQWHGRASTCLILLILVVWIRDVPLRLTYSNIRYPVGGAVGGGIALLKEVHHSVWVLILHDLIPLSVVILCFVFIDEGRISQLPALVAYCHSSPATCTLSPPPLWNCKHK